MRHFLEYRRASYDLILEAESKASVFLDSEVEAWTVNMFARYMETPHIPTDAIAIQLMSALNESGEVKRQHLEKVAEECVLVDGLELNKRRWPSGTYYREMGRMAFSERAWLDRPPELFYERLAYYLTDISKVLHKLKP